MQIVKGTKSVLASSALSLVIAFILFALTIYGIMPLIVARIFLGLAVLIGVFGIVSSEYLSSKPWKQLSAGVVSLLVLGLLAWWIDTWGAKVRAKNETANSLSALTLAKSLITPPIPPAFAFIKTSNNSPIRVKGNQNVVGNTITQGPGSALSFNQQGGVTAGTIINPGPPPPTIRICISDPQIVDATTGEMKQIFTLTTSSEVSGPTYGFDFSGEILKNSSASSPDMAMNIKEGVTTPTGFAFQLNQIWYPGERINLEIHSIGSVILKSPVSKLPNATFVGHIGGCNSGL